MNLRIQRRWVRGAAAALLMLLLASVAGSLQLLRPLPAWTPPSVILSPSKPRPSSALDLAVVWQRDLRQPLFDAPPLPAKPPPETPPPMQLAGTAVEAQRRFAIFALEGNTVVKEVGETVGGWEVLTVERGRARLRKGAREVDLTVPWYDRLQAGAEAAP